MFLEAQPGYTDTDTEIQPKKDNFLVVKAYLQKDRNVLLYSDSDYSVSVMYPQTNYSSELNSSSKLKPSSPELKKAMFRTSSRGIAKALNRRVNG